MHRAADCKMVAKVDHAESDIHAYFFEQTDVQRVDRWGSQTVILISLLHVVSNGQAKMQIS